MNAKPYSKLDFKSDEPSPTLEHVLECHLHVRPQESLAVPVDIKQEDGAVIVYADLPGVDEDDIHIEVTGRTLTISGERDFDHDNEDPEDFLKIERPYGRYNRKVNLPGGLNAAEITAKYKRGVLKVRVPRGKSA